MKALNSAVYPVQWMGLIICCGMSMKRMGMLALSVKKVGVTDCEDGETDTDW